VPGSTKKSVFVAKKKHVEGMAMAQQESAIPGLGQEGMASLPKVTNLGQQEMASESWAKMRSRAWVPLALAR